MPHRATNKHDWCEVATVLFLVVLGISFAFFMRAVVVLVADPVLSTLLVAVGGGAVLAIACAVCRRPCVSESAGLPSGTRAPCDYILLSYGLIAEQRESLQRISAPGPETPGGRARATAQACD